jgi:NAD(P)-dependent dehydrogenase (short-subunit alcohol dehydrogenase family)
LTLSAAFPYSSLKIPGWGHDVQELKGRTAVVTGAASGIGRAIVQRLVAEGMQVVLADVEPEALAATTRALERDGARVLGVPTDVTEVASLEALLAAANRRFGNVHVLCNNAGVGPPAEPQLWLNTPNDWRWTFGVNVFGVANGLHVFLPHMVGHGDEGHVVNTSSPDGGIVALPSAAVYASSKAAVVTMTECLHHQLRTLGARIGASVLLPAGGLLLTGLWTADRNRPEHLVRERPRSRPAMTAEQFREHMARQGQPVPVMPLEAVASWVVDGIRTGRFWLLPDGLMDDEVRGRAEAIIARKEPYLHRVDV